MGTILFKTLKDEWVKAPAFRAEYERLKPEFAHALAKAYTKKKKFERVLRKGKLTSGGT